MHFPLRLSLLAASAVVVATLSSCSGGPQIKGLPKNLPTINLHGSKETPPHSMDKSEYPFDTEGNYKTDWVANGGRGSSESDYGSWRSSHGGEPTPAKNYTPPKKKTTTSRTTIYKIKPGDSLSVIAARHKTTVSKLKAANGLKSDLIRAGKTLKIP